ncbi:winged helix-turn-helix transcriptional regulator [Floccifex sp.]|uniref:winged helix-turn-helix transcriptional regulator n=1 Tax=Floccifex sp. TaxID=2815810 RepID=UPI002A749E91|nr:winged helix-turn-helix transcriptional regulator [Floccifex sp.]MDD7280878.1 HTH domain-containing protein [Erysipelotrichaceae bacterium]MDY2958039.1 HTH domain-containing protein [Floccifex sp.]
MLILLSKNGKMTSIELAKELDTNVRNIREYRKELEAAGFQFQSVTGINGGIELENCKVEIISN